MSKIYELKVSQKDALNQVMQSLNGLVSLVGGLTLLSDDLGLELSDSLDVISDVVRQNIDRLMVAFDDDFNEPTSYYYHQIKNG